jgi:WD40 repeat protein
MNKLLCYLLIILSICLSADGFVALCNENAIEKNGPGTILINVRGSHRYYEYSLVGDKNQLRKTKEGEKEDKSREFIIAEKELKKEPSKLDQLSNSFSLDEMISMVDLSKESTIGKCESSTSHPIKPIKDLHRIEQSKRLFDQTLIITNKQMTHAVITSPYIKKYSGSIIDIRNREIIFTFCGNVVREALWSPDGNFIAYAISSSINDLKATTLVIYDIQKKKSVFRKELVNEYISSISWHPASKQVAIVTKTARYVGFNPMDYWMIISGHPREHNNFNLRIFDFEKEVEVINNFITDIDNADSEMFWVQ